ncbi:MupA/Atu3671 family FMN-dependent luciferase-like monooxygenase [Actinophytocola oryzae]|uniref:Natural product biosynthesis luciferase-like monooxygenase protein n=1 Tax=Actinophytocola oryzae TaxID=502181 RepID=A0A4R7VHQ2_9PSEU|nr:MupA/Atu3671 family FMN-dependent luciferase-like monooxygenase [Actinophytocola oryzae]TDV48687.1 natural product biosynthesis luciferase-like monooxygenase protein [Actinophytocola oryzae]
MDISLFYFADDASASPTGCYDLLLDGARFADDAGFRAVWTPERHFHRFGGLYPSPAVTGAAVAAVTRRVEVRAGSVVLPLHDPIRVAEEWSMIDNLSGGRVALAFASGWHAVDFALCADPPQAYRNRRALLAEHVDTVRRLWRGESVERVDGAGERTAIRVLPAPVQPELPFWITSSGSTETFRTAGELGGNVLTHLLGQNLDSLRRNIQVYREARVAHDGAAGHVTLMLHTFLGDSDDEVRARIREPFSRYLASSVDLIARSGPTLGDVDTLSESDRDALVRRSFDRYSRDSGLFGSPDSARRTAQLLADSGIDEIACLIDFGVDRPSVLKGLEHLAALVAEFR